MTDGCALVSFGSEDQADDVPNVVIVGDELNGEPIEEFGVAGLSAFPIVERFDETGTKELLPDAIDDDSGEADVLGSGDQDGEAFAGIGGGLHQAIEFGAVVDPSGFLEGPDGLNGFIGFERDANEGFPRFVFFEEGEGDATRFGDGGRFAIEHGGEGVEIALGGAVVGGIVTAGALKFDAEKRGGDDVSLGGEGGIVFGGHAESGGAAFVFAAAQHDEFGDETVEGFAVAEGIVQEPAEGAGAVECGVEEGGVFSELIEPIADPLIGEAFVFEERIDDAVAVERRWGGGGVVFRWLKEGEFF